MLTEVKIRTFEAREKSVRLSDERGSTWRLELNRFHGHLILSKKGVRNAPIQTAISGGIQT